MIVINDFGFPIVNFPWLSGAVPRLPSYGIYISQLVRFARYCTGVFYFHSKNPQNTSKLLTQSYRYHKLRKTFGKFFRSYSELLSNFGAILFQEYVSKGIAHPALYGDFVLKLRRIKGEAYHFVGLENSETPSTSPVWPSNHREGYRSCAWHVYSLVQIIP